MNQPRKSRYGTLDCYVVDAGDGHIPAAMVVLCHGYGAPGSDLLGVVSEWIDELGQAADKFRFLCPIAPHSLADLGMPGGRAWWPLNMARLMEAIEARRFEELHRETPPGLDGARAALAELINLGRDELAKEIGCDPDRVPLAMGGFSQGAMLTMDTALRGAIPAPQLLIQFSGTIICQRQWTESLVRLADTAVYQSHGTVDPILPYRSAERLRDLLAGAGIDVDFHAFAGPHTIDGQSIVSTAKALRTLVDQSI